MSILPTRDFLALQQAHAKARQAVHSKLDLDRLASDLAFTNLEILRTHSAAPDRATYLKRPDLGRRLASPLPVEPAHYDVAFTLADGLSALAVQQNAAPLLRALNLTGWQVAPLVLAEQARVAIGDEIAIQLGASLSIILIGERPGLSSADSMGIYLTWNPRPDTTEAARNCISNIRPSGLSYEGAAHKLLYLMQESRRINRSGLHLKEDAPTYLTYTPH